MKKIVKAVATVAVAAVAVTAIVATAGAAGAAVGVAAGMYLGVSSATAVTISTVATAGGYALAGAIGATALSDAGEELTGTNVIRDKLMGGNQDLYNTVRQDYTLLVWVILLLAQVIQVFLLVKLIHLIQLKFQDQTLHIMLPSMKN